MNYRLLAIAYLNPEQFSPRFMGYLRENLHVYRAFEREALRMAREGHRHYSARTIIEVLRHHSALAEKSGAWKLNNDNTPYLARLFMLAHPKRAYLFEFRETRGV